MSENFDLALRLAAAGIPTFPCYAEASDRGPAKRCVKGIYWRKDCTTDTATLHAWWRMEPDGLPAISLERIGCFVVDLDRHHEAQDGVAAWEDLIAKYGDPKAPRVATPSGGIHLYFRQPIDGELLGNHRGILPAGIDIRGVGGYVIAPEARLPDGRSYAVPVDLPIIMADASEPPDWLLAMIRAKKEPERPANAMATLTAPVSSQASDARVRAYSDAAFAAELQKLQSAPKGARNNTLNECAFSIGTLVGAGWVSGSAASYHLLEVALAIGLARPEAVATIGSGLKAGMASPREMPESEDRDIEHGMGPVPDSFLRLSSGGLANLQTGEIFEGPAAVAPPVDNSQDWLEPGGLLGDIADWIERTTPSRRNRPFAIAAAIVIIGTALGRTLYGPTRTGTNLYITCLGESGTGKNWPLKSVSLILSAAGIPQAAGSGEWKSQVALENAVYERPCHVAVADEIGTSLFSQIMGKKANQHQAGISSTLRGLWDANGTDHGTSLSAARSGKTIQAPSLSIYGASTTQEFFNSLSEEALTNGFLARLTVIHGATGARTRANQVLADTTVPESIVARVKALLSSTGGDLVSGAVALSAPARPHRELMSWADTETSDAFDAMRAKWDALCANSPEHEGLVSRVAEMAQRLAVIHAASRAGRGAALGVADWQFGAAVAEQSARFMMTEVRQRIAVTQNQAESQIIERIVREACLRDPAGITRSMLLRKVNGRIGLKPFDSLMRALVESDTVAFVESASTGGRPSQRYVYLGERIAA